MLSVVREKKELSGKFNQRSRYFVKTFWYKDFHWSEVAKNLLSSFAILNFKRRRKVNVLNLMRMLSTSKQMENVTCKTSL